MNYLYMLAAGQSFYRVYNSLEAMTWQPNSSLKTAPRLSEESHVMAKQNGLRDDIQIVWTNLYGEPAMAMGNNSYRYSAAFILVDRDYVVSENNPGMNDAMNVIMRHEYSHLRHDDFSKSKLLPALVSLISTVGGFVFLSPLATFTLTTFAGLATQALYSRYTEERADDEAFQQSSENELKCFQQLLELNKSNNIQLHKKSVIGQLCFSSEGNDRRQFFTHPSLNDRIRLVSKAMDAKATIKFL